MTQQQDNLVWVVVLVESGVPALVEAYSNEREAVLRKRFLRQDINLDYDEVNLFEIKIDEVSD